jgi:hypothetical protein
LDGEDESVLLLCCILKILDFNWVKIRVSRSLALVRSRQRVRGVESVSKDVGASFRKHGLNARLGVPNHDYGVSINVFLQLLQGGGALSTRFGFHLDADPAGSKLSTRFGFHLDADPAGSKFSFCRGAGWGCKARTDPGIQ